MIKFIPERKRVASRQISRTPNDTPDHVVSANPPPAVPPAASTSQVTAPVPAHSQAPPATLGARIPLHARPRRGHQGLALRRRGDKSTPSSQTNESTPAKSDAHTSTTKREGEAVRPQEAKPRVRRSGLASTAISEPRTARGDYHDPTRNGTFVDLHEQLEHSNNPDNYVRGSSAKSLHKDCPFMPDEPGTIPDLNWSSIGGDPAENAQSYTEPDYVDPRLPSSPPPIGVTYISAMEWLCGAEPPEAHDALMDDENVNAFVIDLISGKRPDIYARYDNTAQRIRARNKMAGP